MRVIVIVAATLCVAKGDLPSSAGDLTLNCRQANELVDRAVANSNFEIKKRGEDNMDVDWYGFDTDVNLYVFGLKLPWAVSLSIQVGNLTGINTLKRVTDGTDCSSPVTRTMESIFEYGPELLLKYDVAKAKFLFWEVDGKFVFKPKPRMHVALHNGYLDGTYTCRFMSISSENPGESEYILETENSWKGWLVSKLLTRGLKQKDETTLGPLVDLCVQGEIAAFLTQAWCQLILPPSNA